MVASNRYALTLFITIIALLSVHETVSGNTLSNSILPPNFNPSTCEQDREDPNNPRRAAYEMHSCDGLRAAYRWEPIRQAVLDAANGLPHPGSSFSDPTVLQRLKSSLSSLAASANRLGNDYQRPPQESRDLLGDYLNWSKKLFAEREWDVPASISGVFESLEARVSKPYVEPLEQQAVLLVAAERASALVTVASDVSRVMVDDAEAFAGRRAFEERKQAEAAELAARDSYVTNVQHRAKKFQGLGKMLFGAAFMAGLGVFLTRRWVPTTRGRMIAFAAGTAGLFLASLGAGVIQLLTGIPTWAAFALVFVVFGILYVLFRDKLNAIFPGAATLATHGSAAWAAIADAIQHGRLFDRGLVSADSYGFALGRFPNAPANLDPRLRFMGHVLTCAPTGSGKGIGAVIPTLLEYPGSALVLDIKGENYAVTARARRTMGHAVYLIDPFDVTGGTQSCFNPLDTLDLANPDLVGQVSAMVDTLVVVSGEQSDNSAHFNDSAKDLIKGLIVYAANQRDPAHRTFAEVRRLLTLPLASAKDSGRESLMDHLSDMSADPTLAFGVPARCANGFLSKDSKEASGVHSTALRHTAFLDDPRIAAALSRSDFSFSDLKREPMTVYVVMPPDKLAAQTRFMRALVGAALSAITATNDKPRFNVLFLLDEFAQLGRMPAIEDAISLVRGYGARFWLFVQDLSQLKGVYPRWQTFLANSAKQFYGTADFETAKYVSDMLGQQTIEFRTVGDSSSSSMQGGGSSGSSTSQQLAARSLLTPDEVMRQGAMRPIVLVQGERPYSLERINYLADREYAGLADPNPFHR
jgi:type IV secretory pathway TraG/TraD family ATPase VirD4